MGKSGSRLLKFLFAACLGLAIAYPSRGLWLPLPARFLVRAVAPEPAEVAVVLAGDQSGNRILTAANLARSGYVKKVLVSGPSGVYGHYESELAIAYAVSRGFPADMFIPVPNLSRSTRAEAVVMVDELRQMNVRKFLLVTSDYHTRRAGAIYRSVARGLDFRVVAAPDEHFHPENWWKDREAKKVVFLEWTKTIAGCVGL
ncbi:MAG: YdcF family protein [Bryobacteraceae bacterium]